MEKEESNDKNKLLVWIKDNTKLIFMVSTIVGVFIVNYYCKKSTLNQNISEYDFLNKGSMDKVNEYRESIRLLHCKGKLGMMEKLNYIDKVVRNRPENMSDRNVPFSLPPREHGWNLYKRD